MQRVATASEESYLRCIYPSGDRFQWWPPFGYRFGYNIHMCSANKLIRTA